MCSSDLPRISFTLQRVAEMRGPNYAGLRGTFEVRRGNTLTATLEPEKRIYDVGRQPTTEAGIEPTFWGDLYAVIGDPDGKGGYVTRIYFNPLVAWMWAGACLMVLGAGISLSDRRYRVRSATEAMAEARI